MLPGRTTHLLLVLVVAGVVSAPAAARASDACKCEDIPKLEKRIQKIDGMRNGWYQVLADLQGHVKGAPGTPAAARQTFYDKMGWNPENVRKIGGLDPKTGATYVDEKFQRENCQAVGDANQAHEDAHFWYFMSRMFNVPLLDQVSLAKVLVRSEIDSSNVEIAHLQAEVARLKDKCDGKWKCRCTGELFKTAGACAATCPRATFRCVAPTCIELDRYGKKTGRGM